MDIKGLIIQSIKRKSNLFAFSVFLILVLGIYGQSIFFSYCIDDNYYFRMLPADYSWKAIMHSLSLPLNENQFRPVTNLSFILESFLFGHHPAVHHFFNVVIFVCLNVAIFFSAKKIFRDNEYFYWIALLASVIFIIHPVHANVVSSLKNRESLLSLFFGISAIYVWLLGWEKMNYAYILISLVLLIVGALSKADILPFLAIIPLIGYISVKNINLSRYILVSVVFMFLSFFIPSLIKESFMLLGDTGVPTSFTENKFHLGIDSIFNQFNYRVKILWLYEKFMIVPMGYFFYFGYDHINISDQPTFASVFLLIIHLLLLPLFLVYGFVKKKKWVIGPIVFFLSIAPFLNETIAGYIAVRYAFVASLGFCLSLSLLIIGTIERFPKFRSSIIASLVLLGLGLAILSFIRSSHWYDHESLYNHDMKYLQKSVVANRMASSYYLIRAEHQTNLNKKKSDLNKSLTYITNALNVYPNDEFNLLNKAKIHDGLGQYEASLLARRAIYFTDSTNIANARIYSEYALQKEFYESAISPLKAIIAIDTSNLDAFEKLTFVYSKLSKEDKALALNKSLNELGYSFNAYKNLTYYYYLQNDLQLTNEYLALALDMKPNDKQLLSLKEQMKQSTK